MKMIFLLLVGFWIIGCMRAPAPDEDATLPDFDKLWDFNDPAQTEIKFREILNSIDRSQDLSYYTQLLTQIARSLGLQRKFEAAHALLDTVEPWLNEAGGLAKVRYLLERGRVFNSSGKPEKAKPIFLSALESATAARQDYYAIDAIHMLQIVEPPEKQLEWANKAITLAEQTSDQRARNWLGPLYNNTGWSYFDLKKYDKALELFEKSLTWRQEQNDAKGTVIAKWCMGRTFRAMGRIQEALDAQLSLEKEVNEKKLDQDGYIYEEIAECLLELEHADEAKKYFGLAYKMLSQDEWLQANEPERLARLKNLSE